MRDRFSNVVYWSGCIISAIMLVFNINTISRFSEPDWQGGTLLIGIAILPWLLGRAFRYVVAGR